MKIKFNFLYWLLLPVLALCCYYIINGLKNNTSGFYGYTENKETQINVDQSSVVQHIFVSPGQIVKKGQLLIELNKSNIDKDITNMDLALEELKYKSALNVSELMTSMEKIETEKKQKISALSNEISEEESRLAYNKALVKEVLTSSPPSTKIVLPAEAKIASLKKELADNELAYDKLLLSYKNLISKTSPTKALSATIVNNKNFLLAEKEKLKIYAPFDGIVGNINCKEFEFVPSHSTLISFYELHPSSVVAYIHESLSLSINVGDSISVQSSLHSDHLSKGVVVGKGHRIVEIPERLRKLPEYKTYGMEVFISLDKENRFLQKEVVLLGKLDHQSLF